MEGIKIKKNYLMPLLIVSVLLVLSAITALSYANWLYTSTQSELNNATTACFELNFIEDTTGITLSSAYPISDEEGLSLTGYTFTITNVCNTYAIYQVNLEDIVVESNRLSNNYIKVSINDSTPKVLSSYVEVEPTISTADESFKLTSGSLAPDESVTYEVKIWMDYDTPAIDSVMNATFESKVTVITSYINEENLDNNITIVATSNSATYDLSETFTIEATSSNYNIIEYSYDNTTWTSVTGTTSLTLTKTYTEEGTYYVYIKDEVGNIETKEITTTYIDQSGPEISISDTNNQSSVTLEITLTDTKSGVNSYAITTSITTPSEWENYTDTVTETITSNDTYYIWAKDNLGNISYRACSVSVIDTQAPEIVLTNTLTDWGKSDTINIYITDDNVGISGYQVTTTEEIPTEWITVDNDLELNTTYDVTSNGTYYVYAKDAYDNVSYKDITISYIDREAPSIILSEQSNYGTTSIITAIVSDGESGIVGYLFSTSEDYPSSYNQVDATNSDTYTYEASSNGIIYFYTIDKAGNVSADMINVTKVDKEAPIINYSASGTEGENNWYLNLTLTFTASDELSGVASVQFCTTSSTSCTPSNTASLTNGTFSLSLSSNASARRVCVIVTDNLNNESDVTCTDAYYVDTDNPTATWSIESSTEGSDGWYSALTLKATLSDSASGVASAKYCTTTDSSCTPSTDATISNDSFTVTLENNSDSQAVCTIVTDTSGRTSSTICSSAYYVDTVNPTITYSKTGTAGTSPWYKSLTINIGVSDSESGISSVKYCTTTDSSCTPSTSATISNGTISVTLGTNSNAQKVCTLAVDTAGNETTLCTTNSYYVDTSNPTASFTTSVTSGKIYIDATSSTDNGSGIATYYYSMDNSTWSNNTTGSANFSNISDGTYTVYVKVEDNSGRVSSVTSASVEVACEYVYVSSSGSDSNSGSISNPLATLSAAYTKACSSANIILLSNITQTSTSNFNTSSKSITLTSYSTNTYSITRSSSLTSAVIAMDNSNTLNLKQITVSGGTVSTTAAVIDVSGSSELIINSGTTLSNEGSGTGTTIYLHDNTSLTVNDGTISSSASNAILGVYSDVVINSGTITSTSSSSGYHTIYLWDSTAVLNGGTISMDGSSAALYLDGGVTYIYDGVQITDTSTSSYTIYTRYSDVAPELYIYGGTFSGYYLIGNNGNTEISGGEFSTTYYDVYNYSTGVVNISNGDFSATYYALYNNGGTATLSGGEINNTGSSYAIYNLGTATLSGSITITQSSTSYYAIQNGSSSDSTPSLTMSGGTINTTRGIRNYAIFNMTSGYVYAGSYCALYNNGGTATLSGTSYLSNSSSSYYTIYNYSGTITVANTVTVVNNGGGGTTYGTS